VPITKVIPLEIGNEIYAVDIDGMADSYGGRITDTLFISSCFMKHIEPRKIWLFV
jgi:hypothetical protein